jgi:hypothetical protein
MKRSLAAIAFALAACGGSGGGGPALEPSPLPPPPAPPPGVNADITLLFMGNSHTSVHDVPGMVTAMVRAARPGRTVESAVAPGWMFLEQRSTDAASLQLLRSREWTFVVLQAQEYSSSGQFEYPIDGAVALVRMARAQHAVPIMFPEWPRRGIDETRRIFDLHVSIARREPACVPPIPQAFDLAQARDARLVLHEPDGNHSSANGAFLAALVIASTMTGVAPDALPFLDGLGVDAAVQSQLRRAAAETVLVYPPRQWCPADPYPPA